MHFVGKAQCSIVFIFRESQIGTVGYQIRKRTEDLIFLHDFGSHVFVDFITFHWSNGLEELKHINKLKITQHKSKPIIP